jgi:hypothetical protein
MLEEVLINSSKTSFITLLSMAKTFECHDILSEDSYIPRNF